MGITPYIRSCYANLRQCLKCVAHRLKEQNIPEHLKNGSVNSAHVVIPISGPPPVCSYTGPWVFLWIKAAQITVG